METGQQRVFFKVWFEPRLSDSRSHGVNHTGMDTILSGVEVG